ncbi:EamA family transporter [Corynebacterium comes]|uniref:Threonine/homoserine exporter RhtA n=1 Tax=Corynebacterium comes TaxID=2675218 RepID=A0A6B8VUF0_9CORY|nr:EamA family transporter [Corynebacterium comes]QGU04994.1 Threonine/homoserine exporter RhtA [Corynebacterium comes]
MWAAPAVMVASSLSLYAGAAVAIGLFGQFPPLVVAWMRIAAAALILLVLYRPGLRSFTWRAVVFGVATLGMNMTFYEAIARLPLGTAVAIEFLGPVLVAAVGSRSARDWLALVLAAVGVVTISGAVWSTAATGVLFALAAGAMWAVYIVVGSRIVGGEDDPRAAMTVGFTAAAVLSLPLVWLVRPEHVSMPGTQILGLALGLGVLSAVIPYSLDQVVMRMAGPAGFALLQALLPASAAVLGAIVLGQFLSVAEGLGIVLVIAAIVLRRRAG